VTVVDASAVVDLLLPPEAARREFLIGELPDPAAPWLAPDILPFEVFAVVRRHRLRDAISLATADRALDRLRRLPIELIPTLALIDGAWRLRDRCGAGDSLYAALALRASEPLLTTDGRLAAAAGATGIAVRSPERAGS
jgi:predicted nucleic acid-binding protein